METIRQLKALWAYASWCAQAPAAAPVCDPFWTGVAVAAVTAFASRVADPVTMSRYRVDPEKFHPDPPQEEGMERRIRQALDEKKLEGR